MKDKYIEQYINELVDTGILESIGDGISIQDNDFKILYQNSKHKSFVGDHIGEYCYKAYEKRKHLCEGCPLKMSMEDGLPHTAARKAIINEAMAHFEITASPLRNNKGKIIAGIEVVRDVSERMNYEEYLRESEEKYRLLFSAEKDAIIIVDAETHNIIDANDSALRLYGYSMEEILKLSGPDLSAEPEKSKAAIKAIYMSTDNQVHYHSRYHKKKDETIFPVEISSGTFKLKDKKVVSGIIRDITEHQKALQELSESEKHYHSLLDISPDAIVETGLDGKILFCNQQAAKMHGYDSPAELIGQDSLQSMFKEDIHIAQNNAAQLLDKGYLKNSTFRMRKKDGTPIPVEVSASLLRNAEGIPKSFIGYLRDISERRKAENEQKRLTKELIIKNKELEQMLYVTSHDLRSPLVNVEGYGRELEYSLKDLMSSIDHADVPSSVKDKMTPIVKEDIPESLYYIRTSVSKMNTLIKGILTLSRLRRSSLTIEDIDMNKMMTDIIDSHSFRLNELKIKIDISSLPNCKGDSSQINQVFSNLLDNAVKYTDPEQQGVILISGYKDKNQSVYCMDDNGIGIAPDHQEKIFEIFHQLEPNKVKGEGMGLTIAHRILERHHGKIWVESELGKRSKFFVSLPS